MKTPTQLPHFDRVSSVYNPPKRLDRPSPAPKGPVIKERRARVILRIPTADELRQIGKWFDVAARKQGMNVGHRLITEQQRTQLPQSFERVERALDLAAQRDAYFAAKGYPAATQEDLEYQKAQKEEELMFAAVSRRRNMTHSELLGMISLTVDPLHRKGEMRTLVAPGIRGIRVGREMRTLLLNWAFTGNFRKINSYVLKNNKASLRLNQKLGFRVVGTGEVEVVINGREIGLVWLEITRWAWISHQAQLRGLLI